MQTWMLAAFVAGSWNMALGGDWPQWRGPARDGVSPDTGLLAQWPAGGPKLIWTARDLGGGYGGPSVVAGRIYGMGYRDTDEVVWALNAPDGKELWSTKLGQANRKMGYAEGPRCTPTVDGSLCFVLGGGGNLACLETASGRLVWQKDLVKEHGAVMMSGWGFSESPLVDGDLVVCTPGGAQGTMLALNKKTGQKLWQSAEIQDKAAYSSIVVASLAGVRQYVQLTDAHVFGADPASGKVLWKAERKGRTAVVPTPIIRGDVVYVTSGYAVGCHAFRISKAGSGLQAEPVYANKEMVNHHGGVVLLGDHLYGYSDGKGWVCQEFQTGTSAWRERSKLGKGAISCADGHLYLRQEDGPGTMVLIEATPRGFVEKGRFDQPDRSDKNSWPHPVIVGGRLYLRDQGVLLCYDVSKG